MNVLSVAQASSNSNAAAPACTGMITFANAAGAAIGSAISFATTGSQIYSKQLAFSDLSMTGNRGEFVATVQVTTSFPPKTPCAAVFSLETFDSSTGATHSFLSNSAAAAGVRPVVEFPFSR